MVIVRKDFDTKEIEIQGFRKILNNPKHPDYKELKLYIKKGWIPVDTEDDEREIEKAKRRKKVARENKARRPSYKEMENNLQKLLNDKKIDKSVLDNFKAEKENKEIKNNNYSNVLKWYNGEMEKIQKELNKTPKKIEKDTKSDNK